MADNASIARPYAKAVFSLAEESGSHASWESALQSLSAICSDEQVTALVNDPNVKSAELSKLLKDLVGDQLPEGGANFIDLFVQNGRVDALPNIHAQFVDLAAKAKAEMMAEVITAMPLSDAQSASISAALEQRLGLKVVLEETVDKSLIGGAVIKAGDLVIDGSAKGRIEKLDSVLMR